MQFCSKLLYIYYKLWGISWFNESKISRCQWDDENYFWDFFSLLLNLLFRDSKRYSYWSLKEKFSLSHWQQDIFDSLSHIVCNKCMVIYYKIVEVGLPSKRSFCRDKEFSPWGFPPPLPSSCCQRDKEIFLWRYPTMGTPSKKSSHRLVANETKKYFFEGLLLL